MTRLFNPAYPFHPASPPTPNLPHANSLIIKSGSDKLRHFHGTLPLATQPPTPQLEKHIIEHWLTDMGRDHALQCAVRVPSGEFNRERENGGYVGSPTGKACAVPGSLRC